MAAEAPGPPSPAIHGHAHPHRHRRKPRLSLPSIRISAPETASLSGSPFSGANSLSSRHGSYQTSRISKNDSSAPSISHGPPSETGQDYDGQEENQPSKAVDGVEEVDGVEDFMPDELVRKIQKSMQNVSEYERRCAMLEHDVEHKIILWSDILERYELQDTNATDLRDSISNALATLASTSQTISSSRDMSLSSAHKVTKSSKALDAARESIEHHLTGMQRLEEFMRQEEETQGKVVAWQRGLIASASTLVVLLAIIIGVWLKKTGT